jgi:hypothetical protein
VSDGRLHTYLDTSALMRRAEGAARTSTARNAKIRPVLDAILAEPSRIFACSELTLLEFHSNITTNLRSNVNADWDYEWWTEARQVLLEDIGSGRIEVLQAPPKYAEHVMSLVTIATQEHHRALKAWDAMHAVIAGRWAYELGTDVVILTSDDDFDKALAVTNFGSRVTFDNLDVLASTGEGFDRPDRS